MIRLTKPTLRNNQYGFTLAEITIASGVFAVVLLVVVLATIGFFTIYLHSLTNSSVQNTAQSISNTIEQAIKYTSASNIQGPALPPGPFNNFPSVAPSYNPGYFCVGGEEFTYYLGSVEGSNELTSTQHALYESPEGGSCTVIPQSGGVSLLGDHYRLLNNPVQSLNTYKGFGIDIKIAFTSGGPNGNGDDLLCSPTVNNCTTPLTTAQLTNGTVTNIACRYGTGSQFCKVVELQSVIGAHVF